MARKHGKPMSRRAQTVAWGWLLLVVAYVGWGAATERGLYGWLMQWQVRGTGTYSGTFTFALPIVMLGLPSLWLLFGHAIAVEAAARKSPALQRRYQRRLGFALLALSGASLIAGIFGLFLAAGQPAWQEPAEATFEEIVAGAVPEGRRVVLMVRHDTDAVYGFDELNRRTSDRTTIYRGVRPVPKDYRPDLGDRLPQIGGEPIRLFSHGSYYQASRRGAGEEAQLADVIQISGFVIPNGLPDFVRQELTERGVRIAEPHFVLTSESARDGHLTLMGVGFFFAFVFGVIGLMVMIKAGSTGT